MDERDYDSRVLSERRKSERARARVTQSINCALTWDLRRNTRRQVEREREREREREEDATYFGRPAVIMRLLRKAAHVAFKESRSCSGHRSPTSGRQTDKQKAASVEQKEKETLSGRSLRCDAMRCDSISLLEIGKSPEPDRQTPRLEYVRALARARMRCPNNKEMG